MNIGVYSYQADDYLICYT